MSEFSASALLKSADGSTGIDVGKFPPQSQVSITVNGISTDIVSTNFEDHIFVVITQINKFGTMIKAWSENRGEGGKLFETQPILGKRDDVILQLYARQIIEKISYVSTKPLLLAISLKQTENNESEISMMKSILTTLYEIANWS
mmetsp:Transcript_9844/g.9947  ORF Transcript_9844/g.9947 Transcript_9844/m.9947 type:complete len:145 (+) Transcript_9844:143-577(+)